MSRGSRVRSPPEADTFTAVHGEIGRVLVRYDFNRLAVYLSFRTPIAGKLPPFPPLWRRRCVAMPGLVVNQSSCWSVTLCTSAATPPAQTIWSR